ncbi:discoidin domain-containing protein [Streptomyces sp. NBRC 109706]|uniref:galactose-binding domain-containing protein n=1 Tax=Streptomyces sp. NBRC 109706 TaxID=1550035 RepID=UPI0007807E92|nr:discoidin domain-containing protein [Streptomyces sp. NBRC 109706]
MAVALGLGLAAPAAVVASAGTPDTASQRATAEAAPAPSDAYSAFPVGDTWYDTDGNAIQAHGGGFLEQDGWYYWVGEDKSHNRAAFKGVNLYRSQDLLNWEFVRAILTPDDVPDCADVDGVPWGAIRDGVANCIIERPKIVYNQATDTFVLWAHFEYGADWGYGASHMLVASSDTGIDGDYTFHRHFRPGAGEIEGGNDPSYGGDDGLFGYGSRDFNLFEDPVTGSAYLVSTQDSQRMRVYRLSEDYTDVNWRDSYLLFDGARREAPALVRAGDHVYIVTSLQSGWYPNQAMYAYTSDLDDPNGWSELRPLANNSTFDSQPTNILPLTTHDGRAQYVYRGDRWNPNALADSTYVWLPLDLDSADPTALSLEYRSSWWIDDATGEIRVPDQRLVSQDRPVSASPAQPDRPAGNANDGDHRSSSYKPAAAPFHWQVDLGAPTELARVDLSFLVSNGSEAYSGYTVEASTDGTEWTTLVENTDNHAVGFLSHDLAGEYRQVRVSVSKVTMVNGDPAPDWAMGIVEAQVYAHP